MTRRACSPRAASSRLAPLVVALSVLACGARTSLPAGDGGAGGQAGAGGAGGQGGLGGQGGAGGAGLLCSGLVALEPTFEPAHGVNTWARDPWLLPGPMGRVFATSRRVQIEGPEGIPEEVGLADFDGWGAWPPPPGPPMVTLTTTLSSPFAAHAEGGGTLALAVALPDAGCSLAGHYGLPFGNPMQAPVVFATSGSCDDRPLLAATSGDGAHLRAFDVPAPAVGPGVTRQLRAEVLDAFGEPVAIAGEGCASTPLVADVLPRQDLFFVAHSVGHPSSFCFTGEDIPPPSPARGLLVRRLGAGVDQSELAWTGIDDLVFLRVLPREAGVWLVWRESGASAFVQPGAMAMPMGPDGPLGPPFEVTPTGSDRIAAAAFAGGLATTHLEVDASGVTSMVVRLFREDGALDAQTSVPVSGAWLDAGRLSLLASPDATSLLVGYAGGADDSPPAAQVQVRRIDCTPT